MLELGGISYPVTNALPGLLWRLGITHMGQWVLKTPQRGIAGMRSFSNAKKEGCEY